MSDVRYWIGFNRVPHIGPVRVAALLKFFGDLEAAWHASGTSLRAAGLPRDAVENLLYLRLCKGESPPYRRVRHGGGGNALS